MFRCSAHRQKGIIYVLLVSQKRGRSALLLEKYSISPRSFRIWFQSHFVRFHLHENDKDNRFTEYYQFLCNDLETRWHRTNLSNRPIFLFLSLYSRNFLSHPQVSSLYLLICLYLCRFAGFPIYLSMRIFTSFLFFSRNCVENSLQHRIHVLLPQS